MIPTRKTAEIQALSTNFFGNNILKSFTDIKKTHEVLYNGFFAIEESNISTNIDDRNTL